MNETTRAALERAKARLDRLDLYPEPVRIERLRVFVAPWLFRLPLLSRLGAFTLARTIVFRRPPGAGASDALVTHELVHIWQGQHRRLPLMLSYLRHGYRNNPFEQQARAAAAAARDVVSGEATPALPEKPDAPAAPADPDAGSPRRR